MKNKKYLVSLFVLVALLCLGIGYAAISKTLTINGGVATGDQDALNENFIIYFSKVDIDTTLANGATVTANVSADKNSTSTSFEIKNMSIIGSKVVLTYTVQNDSVDLYANSPTILYNDTEVNANKAITIKEVGTISPFFAITVTPNMVNGQAAPNSAHTITIEVEMISTPASELNFTFELEFVYEATNTAA